MALTFYTSVAVQNVRKVWGLIPTFVEVTREKLVRGLFGPPPSYVGLSNADKSVTVN